MHFNWLVLLCLVAVAYSAIIPQGAIPVKVIYEKEEDHRAYRRNLDNTEDGEVKHKIILENVAKPSETFSNALRNHNEKLQLSQEELPIALRHLPKAPEEVTNKAEDTPKETEEKYNPKIVLPDNIPTPPVQPQQPTEEDKFFDRIQEIINSGVTRIQQDVKQTQDVVAPEIWTSFNNGVGDFLKNVRYSHRQANNATILDQFSSFANNFFGGLTGQNQKPQDGSQQPSFPQNVIQAFQDGIGQMQSSFSAAFSGQRPASDSPSNTSSPNPIQGFVQQLQTSVNNFWNPQQKPADENSTGPFQNIQNSINNALGNFNLFNRPGNPTGDSSATAQGPIQAIQTAIQNFNPFQSTTKPASSSTDKPIPLDPIAPDPLKDSTPGFSSTKPLGGLTNQISVVSRPNITGLLNGK